MGHTKGRAGGGPGTHDAGGVRGTLDAPFKNRDRGTQKTMNAPFDEGRTGGANAEDNNGGMPEEIYSDLGGPSKAPKANRRDSPGTIVTDPKSARR